MTEFGDHVDNAIFSQILEMDDSEADRDFSGPLVTNFFEQATETFEKMDEALEKKDLDILSSLGHFLKGSSATLGFNKIRDSCQIIQQYGHKLNVDGTPEPDSEVCLKKIGAALVKVKEDTADLEQLMNKFFGSADGTD
ncbi:histidine-phosphotransfer domain, HPT domain containing protein [Naviculisporaceae sp. PSN 640]